MRIKKKNFKKYYSNDVFSEVHKIHAYTAKLIPQIPRYLIENYSTEGDLILDPFCGSGTTLVEAKSLKRNAIGVDINPLAILISKVRTRKYNFNLLNDALNDVQKVLVKRSGSANVNFLNMDYWFSLKAKKELNIIYFSILSIKNKYPIYIYDFLLLVFSSIIRKSSFADQKISKVYKSKFVIRDIERGWKPTPIVYFQENVIKFYNILKSVDKDTSKVKLFCKDALNLSTYLKNKKVDLIITSPPYVNAQDYYRSYKLEVYWCNLATQESYKKLKKDFVGNETISNKVRENVKLTGKPYAAIVNRISKIDFSKGNVLLDYFLRMEVFLGEASKVLKTTGILCLITGNSTICGIIIPIHSILNKIALENGFVLVDSYLDEIKNRSLFKNRNHNGGHIKDEVISVFKLKEF